MDRKRFNIILIVSFFVILLFIIGIHSINKSIEGQLTVQVKKMKEELQLEKAAQARLDQAEKQKWTLNSTDLTPYQIVPQRKSRLFKNQQYWDVLTKRALEQSSAKSRIQEGEIFKGITKTPEEFKQQIRLIDSRIKAYKKKIRVDSNDDYARRKLQDLYMLKATVRALRETLVLKKFKK